MNRALGYIGSAAAPAGDAPTDAELAAWNPFEAGTGLVGTNGGGGGTAILVGVAVVGGLALLTGGLLSARKGGKRRRRRARRS
jgi:hypothetical protein